MSLLDVINAKKEEPIILKNEFNDWVQSKKIEILNFFNNINKDNLILNLDETLANSVESKTFKMEILLPSTYSEKVIFIFHDDGNIIDMKIKKTNSESLIAIININDVDFSIEAKFDYETLKNIIKYIIMV